MTKILIIDDEIDICRMLTDFLRSKNYEVIYSITGREGLNIFNTERPRIVILDLCLKDTSGMEILKKIKSTDPSCTVIITTCSADEENQTEAINAGANFYIQKPFPLKILERLLKKL